MGRLVVLISLLNSGSSRVRALPELTGSHPPPVTWVPSWVLASSSPTLMHFFFYFIWSILLVVRILLISLFGYLWFLYVSSSPLKRVASSTVQFLFRGSVPLLFTFLTAGCARRSWVDGPLWAPKLMGQASYLYFAPWSFRKLLPQCKHSHWIRASTWCKPRCLCRSAKVIKKRWTSLSLLTGQATLSPTNGTIIFRIVPGDIAESSSFLLRRRTPFSHWRRVEGPLPTATLRSCYRRHNREVGVRLGQTSLKSPLPLRNYDSPRIHNTPFKSGMLLTFKRWNFKWGR